MNASLIESIKTHIVDIIDQCGDGLFVAEQGRLLYINPSGARIFGFRCEEDYPRTLEDWVHIVEVRDLDGGELPIEEWPGSRVQRGEKFSHYVLDVRRRKDGARYIVSHHGFPVLGPDGTVARVVLVFRDLTEQKKLEETLIRSRQESEERYRLIFEQSIDAIIFTSPDGRIFAANRQACRMFGRSEAEICKVGRSGIVDMTDPATLAFLEERSRNGKACGEITGLRKDGTRFPLEQSSVIFRTKDGELRSSTILRDITERKRAEETIARLNRLYAVLSKVNEAIVRITDLQELLDEVCRITVQNGQFRMAWIGEVDHAKGLVKPIASFGDDKGYLRDISIRSRDTSLESGPTSRAADHETCAFSRDIENDFVVASWQEKAIAHGFRSTAAFPIRQSERVVAILTIYSTKPQFFSEGELELLNSLAADLSHAMDSLDHEKKRIEAEKALESANVELERRVIARTLELEEAIKVRDEFLSIASHELGTPMTALGLQLELSRRSLSYWPEAGQYRLPEMLDRSIAQVRQLSRLLEDLLDITRIRAGKLILEKNEMDLCKVARDVISRFGKQISFIAPEALTGFWDKTRIDQVLSNLLSNAIKYGEGKPIEIRIAEDPLMGRARIIVRDHGMGIPPEHQKKIFERFQRTNATQKIGGLGLGLYIVHQIVDAHGGSVHVESELGRGATFTVELDTANS